MRSLAFLAVVAVLAGCYSPGDLAERSMEPTDQSVDEIVPILSSCSEASIRAHAPVDATTDRYLDRAFDWIHRAVPYCQCVNSHGGGYRTDCSGFVSMTWGLATPGHTTYSFAGGPWDDHQSVRLGSRESLRTGDALNYPGSVSQGTGHIVLFGGWLNSAHTSFCSLEESHTGTPARVIVRSVDPAYLPIRRAGRVVGTDCASHCEGSVRVDTDCSRHACDGRCYDPTTAPARCVAAECPNTGIRDVCISTGVIAHCNDGVLSARRSCGGANPRCRSDASGGQCESPTCPAAGRTDICLPTGQLAHCDSGVLSNAHACAAGTACSDAGAGAARCVSLVCVPDPMVVAVAHDACADAGARIHCDANGQSMPVACPAGQHCSSVGGAIACVPSVCPATGDDVVCNGTQIAQCHEGSLVEITSDCATSAAFCSALDGTAPHCVSTACARPAELPAAHAVCLTDGRIAQCDDEGNLGEGSACATERCVSSSDGAHCPSPAAADAGAGASDAGVSADGSRASADGGTGGAGGEGGAHGSCTVTRGVHGVRGGYGLWGSAIAAMVVIARRRRRNK